MPEIGSLRALANGESQFVGSSSGVYFINTVKRAFLSNADAARSRPHVAGTNTELREDPSPEDCIIGDQTPGATASDATAGGDSNPPRSQQPSPFPTSSDFINDMGDLPDYATARKLVLTYFRIWHPLVPFLQGPECLAELDTLYALDKPDTRNMASISRLVTFRCVFNIARLDSDDEPDIGSLMIHSGSDLLPVLSLLALRSDACSIQALLCAQVYFVATMSLRHASSVGGLVSKSIYQSGMHRCPVRYEHLSPDERSMRKRIFWSFYVLDRFVSQSLGHPNGIQDSDIDVCPPGHRDLHEPVPSSALSPSTAAADNTILHLPANHPDRATASPAHKEKEQESSNEAEEEGEGEAPENTSGAPDDPSSRASAISRHRRETQAVLENHVRHSQLVGRILDVFHRSIHARDSNSQTILFLKADVAAWGNDLATPRLGPALSNIPELAPDPRVFPFVTHHYTVLLLNRPALSLDSRCAEFRSALQICIGASNVIVPTVEQYFKAGGPLFWPGYMSAVWMSGLVLALAARLGSYNLAKATCGIRSSLKLLEAMEKRWAMARDCREVLAMLMDNIDKDKRGQKRVRVDAGFESPTSKLGPANPNDSSKTVTEDISRSAKRRMMDTRRTGRQDGSEEGLARVRPPFQPSRTQTPLARSFQRDAFTENTPRGNINSSMMGNRNFSPNINQQDLDPFSSSQDLNLQNFGAPGTYFAPIPTTFPDRHRNGANTENTFDGSDSFFEMFDGATWGSLIDIVNGAGSNGYP